MAGDHELQIGFRGSNFHPGSERRLAALAKEMREALPLGFCSHCLLMLIEDAVGVDLTRGQIFLSVTGTIHCYAFESY